MEHALSRRPQSQFMFFFCCSVKAIDEILKKGDTTEQNNNEKEEIYIYIYHFAYCSALLSKNIHCFCRRENKEKQKKKNLRQTKLRDSHAKQAKIFMKIGPTL